MEPSRAADVVDYAGQIGRLDLVSALLAAIAVLLVFGGLFAFLNLRRLAEQEARLTSEKVAAEIAERVANEHMQTVLPELLADYARFVADVVTSEGDETARMQDDGEGPVR